LQLGEKEEKINISGEISEKKGNEKNSPFSKKAGTKMSAKKI